MHGLRYSLAFACVLLPVGLAARMMRTWYQRCCTQFRSLWATPSTGAKVMAAAFFVSWRRFWSGSHSMQQFCRHSGHAPCRGQARAQERKACVCDRFSQETFPCNSFAVTLGTPHAEGKPEHRSKRHGSASLMYVFLIVWTLRLYLKNKRSEGCYPSVYVYMHVHLCTC